MKSSQFEVVFEGGAVKDNTIDARDLATSLISLGDLIDEANTVVTRGRGKTALRVKSEFFPGSFEIVFELTRGITDLFTSKTSENLEDILETIGIIAGAAGGAVVSSVGFFRLLKWLKGKKPDRISVNAKGDVNIHLGDNSITVKGPVKELYENKQARKAVDRFVSPLKEDGIDEIRVNREKQEALSINKEEAKYFSAPREIEQPVVTENDAEMIVSIIRLSFKPKEKWWVSDGSKAPYPVGIIDDAFFGKVVGREILFGANDKLRVILRTTQRFVNGELKSSRDIVIVKDHIPIESQRKLGFPKD